jgi:DNA-binding GntR family transcriptional regulator
MTDPTMRLKKAILTGELKPRERLVESDLIDMFNLKRFSVRKAIQELANQGFVELVPNKGGRVADFTDKEIEDIYVVRMSLEHLAAELAIRNLTPEKLVRLREIQKEFVDAVNRGDVEEYVFKNEAFHRAFYLMSDNPFLADHLEKLTNSIFALRYNAFVLLGLAAKSVADHQAVIDAIEEKNLERLKDILKESIILPKMIYLSRKMGTAPYANYPDRQRERGGSRNKKGRLDEPTASRVGSPGEKEVL